MSELPTKPGRIWLRSFYGFSPEDDGYIGWTEEGPRDRMLGLIDDGDLFLIYGASTAETDKSHRHRVLGFLQVEKGTIRDVDKASPDGLQRKRTRGWKDKWTYAIPVVRAWRANEPVLLERIAPKTYRPEAGQAIAVWNPPLLPEEVEEALKIWVREVNVFGEPRIADAAPERVSLREAYAPSRAFPGSSGERTSIFEDGPTQLYLARFEGDAYGLLGQKRPMFDSRQMIKVGVSNDVKRRVSEINGGFPPAALGRWAMQLVSVPYANKAAAEAAEQMFKDSAAPQLESLGGEFFLGEWSSAESVFAGIPGVSRFT